MFLDAHSDTVLLTTLLPQTQMQEKESAESYKVFFPTLCSLGKMEAML